LPQWRPDGRSAALEIDLIQRIRKSYRGNVRVVLIASVLLNLLVFGGSLYMLLIYDMVIPGGSVATLAGLFLMVILLYLLQAGIEAVRSEALLGIANGIHRDMFEPVHHAAAQRDRLRQGSPLQLTRDLDHVHTFLAGSGPVAIIDLPWVGFFLIVLFATHWWLGLTALVGALVLCGLAWVTGRRTTQGTRRSLELSGQRVAATQAELRHAESSLAMGMQERLLARSTAVDVDYIRTQSFLARTAARFGGAGRVFRLFLQSAILTVGAVLVLNGEASGGVMLAASVLAGRALAPVDQALANWRNFSAARQGWARISESISKFPQPLARKVALSPPCGDVVLRDVWVSPSSAAGFVLQGVSFALKPGQALAVIGPSAAGKTTLARALLGILPVGRGEIRIDGATHDQWEGEVIGAAMGYVPQVVELMEGTLGENIARFDPAATSAGVIAAAKAAGLHETILGFADGYETPVSAGGAELSAGQRQRIGLARALYGDPFLVVLDEPGSNLDAAGDAALAQAIMGVRARGGIAVMVTHRPATLGPVSHVAVLAGGKLTDFGPRDEVLGRLQQAGAVGGQQLQGAGT
jgi:ATP-binding cassette subfamily C protein